MKMRWTSRKLTNQSTPLPRTSLHPHRCHHCNRFFHELWFSTSHKKKHVDRYKKFWLKKRPYLRKKSRLDELCEKMRAHQQQSGELGKSSGHPLSKDSKRQYDTRCQSASQTLQNLTAILTCTVCMETFKTESKYKVHLQKHSEAMFSICQRCDKELSRCNCKIAHHQQQYSNDSPFRCLICTKTFAKRPHLVLHQKTHAKEEEHSCNICHVNFSNANILKMHNCAHSKVTCTSCGKEVLKSCAKKTTVTLNKDSTKCQYCNAKHLKTEKPLGEESNLSGHKDPKDSECSCAKKQHSIDETKDQIQFLCPACDEASDKVMIKEPKELCVSDKASDSCSSKTLLHHRDTHTRCETAQTTFQQQALPSTDERVKAKTYGKEKRRKSSRIAFIPGELIEFQRGEGEQTDSDAAADVPSIMDEKVTDLKDSQKGKRIVDQHVMDLSHKKMQPILQNSEGTSMKSPIMVHRGGDKGEENNNKQGCEEREDQDGVLNLAIPKQPLIRNLSGVKIPVVTKRGKGGQKGDGSVGEAASLEENNPGDKKTLQPDKLYHSDAESRYESGSSVTIKKQKLIHTITDKLTEAIIDDLKDPNTAESSMNPLDLSKDSAVNQASVQSSAETSSNKSAPAPESKPDGMKIQIPIIHGTVDCAIEEELLKFYGHAITYIGLTVYREHEKELYGHNLSQVGLFNSSHGSDVMSDEQKRP